MSKHHFAEWTGPNGEPFEELGRKDHHSHCKRCHVLVKMSAGQTTTKFWIDGKWTHKRPPCEPKPEEKCPTGYTVGCHENKDCNCVSRGEYGLGYMQGRGAA